MVFCTFVQSNNPYVLATMNFFKSIVAYEGTLPVISKCSGQDNVIRSIFMDKFHLLIQTWGKSLWYGNETTMVIHAHIPHE
jgi:hypothetical protein